MMKKTNEPALDAAAAPVVEREQATCLRCGYQWFPRAAHPVKCPNCRSLSWDKPRVYQVEGQPPPTGKAKPRGAVFNSETAAEATAQRVTRRGRNSAPKDDDESAPD